MWQAGHVRLDGSGISSLIFNLKFFEFSNHFVLSYFESTFLLTFQNGDDSIATCMPPIFLTWKSKKVFVKKPFYSKLRRQREILVASHLMMIKQGSVISKIF